MKRIYTYVASFALAFGLTAGIYAATGGAFAMSDTQTEVADGDDNTGGGSGGNTGGDNTGGDTGGGNTGGDTGGDTGGGDTGGGNTGGDTGGGNTGGDTGGGNTGGDTGGGDTGGDTGGGNTGGDTGGETGGGGEVTPPTYTIKGVGSLVNPYTIEDLNHIDIETTDLTLTGVWVKGVVYGYVSGDAFSTTTIVHSADMPADQLVYNYVLVDAENAEEPTLAQLAPAMLGGDVDNNEQMRSRLNLGINKSFLGSTVLLCGNITKYKGVNGLINTNFYSVDGTTVLPETSTPTPPDPPTPSSYSLWIGKTQVTTENASNITSKVITKGTVSFDASSKTLTLDGVTFAFDNVEDSGFGINSELDGLNILIKDNVIFNGMTLYVTGNTTVTGSKGATLAFNGGRTLRAFNTSLTLKDLSLTISPGKIGLDCAGSNLTIDNSEVTITACTPVIQCNGEPTLKNCRVVSSTPGSEVAFDPVLNYYTAKSSESAEPQMVTSIYIGNRAAPVSRKSCELKLSTGISSYSVSPSQVATFVAPTGKTVSGYDGEITYRSSNSSIISVNEQTGELTFNARGSVTITVVASQTDKYFGATVSYTVSYGKEDPVLKFGASEVTVPVGAYAHQYGLYPTKKTSADYTLTSSNSEALYIDDLGGIHVGVAGTTILTATVPETDSFYGATVTCTVHVVESMSSNCTFAHETMTVEWGQEATFVGQTAATALGYNGKITYVSSNTDVATVDTNTGAVTLVNPGTTKITARASGTGSYVATSAVYTINYTKATPTLSFSQPILKVKLSQGTAKLPTLINPSGGEVTYRSGNPSIVSVDPQAGTLTLLKVGTAQVAAILAESEHYKGATITCEIQVTSDGTELTVLEVLPTALTFEAAGGEKRIRLRSDRAWTASAGQSWLTLSSNGGDPTFEAGATPTDDDWTYLTATCTPNTDTNSRQTTITIKSGSEIVSVTVVQDGTEDVGPVIDTRTAPKFSVSPSTIDLVVTRSNITLPALVVRYSGDDASQISYESSDASVVRVDEDGSIHVVGQGQAVLKVKASGTEFYKPAEATVTVNATFPDPDLVEDIPALDGDVTVNLAALADKDMSTGGVQDNIYYSMNTDLSVGDGYSAADGCLILNSTMTDAQMDEVASQTLAEVDEDGKFHGIIMKVPAGEGKITIDCQTGIHPLMVKLGPGEAKQNLKSPRGEVEIAYNVMAPTLVYIYAKQLSASGSSLRSVRRAPKKSDATSVLIYGIKVTGNGSAVAGVKADGSDDVEFYSVGGQQVARKNVRHGVFVGTDGSKRAIK